MPLLCRAGTTTYQKLCYGQELSRDGDPRRVAGVRSDGALGSSRNGALDVQVHENAVGGREAVLSMTWPLGDLWLQKRKQHMFECRAWLLGCTYNYRSSIFLPVLGIRLAYAALWVTFLEAFFFFGRRSRNFFTYFNLTMFSASSVVCFLEFDLTSRTRKKPPPTILLESCAVPCACGRRPGGPG